MQTDCPKQELKALIEKLRYQMKITERITKDEKLTGTRYQYANFNVATYFNHQSGSTSFDQVCTHVVDKNIRLGRQLLAQQYLFDNL